MESIKILGLPVETFQPVEIGKGQKEYFAINARQQSYPGQTAEGEATIMRSFIILWEFNKEERIELLKTGRLWYTRMCFDAPFQPMKLSVENPTGNTADDATVSNPFAPELITLFERFTTFRNAVPIMQDVDKSEEVWIELGRLFAQSPEMKDSNREHLAKVMREIAFQALRLAEIHEAKKHF